MPDLTSKNGLYGWRPDKPDYRDYKYATIMPKAPTPANVDLRKFCSPVEDQGYLGSCTANALVGALEFLDIKNKKVPTDMSRLFVYYNERVIEGSVNYDSGAEIRNGIKTLAKQGVCTERIWPYVINKFAKRPSATAYSEATRHVILDYYRMYTLQEMLACLASGYPFVFGFTVYSSFERPSVAKTGIVNMPTINESVLGGHAVMAVGYNSTQRRIIVRNSWGKNWGMKGYFTMPYDYVSNRDLSDDFWVIRKDKG
jgi:C1A family cysteine protease